MFHLEFGTNNPQPEEAREMFNRVSKQPTEETSTVYETHDTNNDQLSKAAECENRENHKNQSEEVSDDPDLIETKPSQPKYAESYNEPSKTKIQKTEQNVLQSSKRAS